MAETLLNKVINDVVPVNTLIKWLLKTNGQNDLKDFNCSRSEFLTYFLNFVHEEIPCQNKNESPCKNFATKRTETVQEEEPSTVPKNKVPTPESTNRSTSILHSTPKTSIVSYQNNFSPVSPLYRQQNNFSTPSNKSTAQAKISTLCLGDFIVNRKSSTKKKHNRDLTDEASKRIKPTCLSQVNHSFRQSENSFDKFQDTKEVDSLNASRNFLAEERLKVISRQNSGNNSVCLKKINNVSVKMEIDPELTCVTNRTHLDYLIEIYVAILNNNCVLNITSEIYFLISLLLSRQYSLGDSSDDFLNGFGYLKCDDSDEGLKSADFFESIHNVVYFSVKCLEMQAGVLNYYDRSTLELLSRNKRLKSFAPAFADKLMRISEKKSKRIVEIVENVSQTVCFNLDTDNRVNFPNDFSFHAFRKQRDLFYEIIRIWETNHLLPGWDFSFGLSGRIRSLLGMQSEPANYMHFARLFKAQLLSTCGKTQKEEGLSENQMPFLSTLSNVDADKLSRLKSRLVTKQSSDGINTTPSFTGYQEFYRDFIVVAANYVFNRHLCDTFIVEIVELNDTKFTNTDMDETENSVDPTTRKTYINCLRLLRVLAKFLGFVESIPYKSTCVNYSENLLNSHLVIRQQTSPFFDVKQLLQTSLKQNTIFLTIPWLTEYLSMLDYVTLRLPYYIQVYRSLFELYRSSEVTTPNKYNSALVKFCLGWLFELPNFPDSEYFKFCTGSAFKNKAKRSKNEPDCFSIVDDNVVYICCPYLEEIKKLLSNNALGGNVTVKHITPVTAVQSCSEIAKKRLEQQLEEAFFNGQPVSVRKTVEFVSERVASTCVKQICNVIVPSFKKSALEELRKNLSTQKTQFELLSPVKEKTQKLAMKTKTHQLAQDQLRSLGNKCEEEILSTTREKIPPSVENLLALDSLQQTKNVCVSITTKMCVERVRQWINSHVTLAVFTKDFDNELQKFANGENRVHKEKHVVLLPPGGREVLHNDASTSPFHLMDKVKVLMVDILEFSPRVSLSVVIQTLDNCYTTFTERCDVNNSFMAKMCSLLVEFSLLLLTHKPSIISSDEVLGKLVRIWRRHSGKTDVFFKNLLCVRNVMMFAQSFNPKISWEAFADFVYFLLKEEMLACEEFEGQCTAFFRKDWDQGTLRNFNSFAQKFIQDYRSNDNSVDKFVLLLDFLSNFCVDL